MRSFGASTWVTGAGPIDVLRDLRDSGGHGFAFDGLIARGVDQQIGVVMARVAALRDIIAAKEHADWEKVRESIPERRAFNRER